MKKSFFSIGYGGRDPHEFLETLQLNGVKIVVDVRLLPSRAYSGSYKLAKDPSKGIEGLLAGGGIHYISVTKLGNKFMNEHDWPERYRKLLEKSCDSLVAELYELNAPFCLLCAEKDPDKCHRKLISDYLVERGFKLLGHL